MTDPSPSVCGYTLVQRGIPNALVDYDGESKLLGCSRCKGVTYIDQGAQKRHWKRHKRFCRQLTSQENAEIQSLSMEECTNRIEQRLCFDPSAGGPDLYPLFRRMRELYNGDEDGSSDSALTLHTAARALIFTPDNSRVLDIFASPHMAKFMILDEEEDLLRPKARFIKKYLQEYGGRPSEEFVEDIEDDEERSKLKRLCEEYDRIDNSEGWGQPGSMSFCFLYFNILVGAALHGNPSMSSVHDGRGNFRSLDDPKSPGGLLAIAALRRALMLWTDPLVLSSCGDAMAPAASLAVNALQNFNFLREENVVFMRDGELVPGLEYDRAVNTCIQEQLEKAGSCHHSLSILRLLGTMVTRRLGGGTCPWSTLSPQRRAHVILKVIKYVWEGRDDDDGFSFGPRTEMPMRELNNIFKSMCGMAYPKNAVLFDKVMKSASVDGEKNGPESAGGNREERAAVYYIRRNHRDESTWAGLDVVEVLAKFEGIEAFSRETEEAIEKDNCYRLAYGAKRHAQTMDILCRIRSPSETREQLVIRGQAIPKKVEIGEQSTITKVPDHAKIGEHRSLSELFMLVFKEMGDKHLDYHAHKTAWSVTAQPFMHMAANRLHCKSEATPAILLNGSFECVKPSDVPPDFCYTMTDDNEDDDEEISFGDTSVKMEYTERHPDVFFCGTISVPFQCNIQSFKPLRHAPITTVAAKYLFSVAFSGGCSGRGGVDVVEMKAAYRLQFALRIDEKSDSPSLNFDCFEFVPTCLDVSDESPDLPTYGGLRKFDNTIEGNRFGDNLWMDATVEHESGNFPSDSVIALNYQAFAGKFMNSRCFRIHVDLSNVCGVRLMSACVDGRSEIEGPNDTAAVLILELKEALGLNEKSFALRTLSSKSRNAFTKCRDFTPGRQASTAKRLFFYGNLEELRQTASVIGKCHPDIAEMLRSPLCDSNTLASGVAVDYDSTPSFLSKSRREGDADACVSLVDDIYPPPPSNWDGAVANAREIVERMLAREENPAKRMMLRVMIDPESALAINQDPNSSPEDIMLSNLASRNIIENRGYDGILDIADRARERREQGDEDCCLM